MKPMRAELPPLPGSVPASKGEVPPALPGQTKNNLSPPPTIKETRKVVKDTKPLLRIPPPPAPSAEVQAAVLDDQAEQRHTPVPESGERVIPSSRRKRQRRDVRIAEIRTENRDEVDELLDATADQIIVPAKRPQIILKPTESADGLLDRNTAVDPIAAKTEKNDPEDERVTIELDRSDKTRTKTAYEPADRLRMYAEDAAERDNEDEEEQTKREKMKIVVANNPEVKRWRERLDAIPVVVENIPAREDMKAKIRKAELLAEQRENDAMEKTAEASVETSAVSVDAQKKKVKELEKNVQEQKAVLAGLHTRLKEEEQKQNNLQKKQEDLVDSAKAKLDAKGDAAVDAIGTKQKEQQQRLAGIDFMIKSAKTDDVREEARQRRQALLEEMHATDLSAEKITGIVRQNQNSIPENSRFDELTARATEGVENAQRAIRLQERVLDDVEHQLADAKLEFQRLTLVHKEAIKESDNAVARGLELAMALGGLAAIAMEDDVHVATEDADREPAIVETTPLREPSETPVIIQPDENIKPKNTLGQNLGALSGWMGMRSLLGLGSAAYATGRFGETFFGNAKKLLDDPEKFFSDIGARFKKEIGEHGGILGTLKGIKWLFVGDPDKKKEQK